MIGIKHEVTKQKHYHSNEKTLFQKSLIIARVTKANWYDLGIMLMMISLINGCLHCLFSLFIYDR